MNRSDTDIPSRGTGWRSWVATLGMCLALLPLHQAHALTMAEALARCGPVSDAWVIGGADIYAQALPLASTAVSNLRSVALASALSMMDNRLVSMRVKTGTVRS